MKIHSQSPWSLWISASHFVLGKPWPFLYLLFTMYVVYGLENLKTGGMTSSPDKLLVASLTIFFAWIGSSASERSGAYSSFLLGFRSFLIRLRCGVRDGPFLEEHKCMWVSCRFLCRCTHSSRYLSKWTALLFGFMNSLRSFPKKKSKFSTAYLIYCAPLHQIEIHTSQWPLWILATSVFRAWKPWPYSL